MKYLVIAILLLAAVVNCADDFRAAVKAYGDAMVEIANGILKDAPPAVAPLVETDATTNKQRADHAVAASAARRFDGLRKYIQEYQSIKWDDKVRFDDARIMERAHGLAAVVRGIQWDVDHPKITK